MHLKIFIVLLISAVFSTANMSCPREDPLQDELWLLPNYFWWRCIIPLKWFLLKPILAWSSFLVGGWKGGEPLQFLNQPSYFAKRGIFVSSPDYRNWKQKWYYPVESIKDCRNLPSDLLGRNAIKFKLITSKISLLEGSAGGHLAAATPIDRSYNEFTG